MTLILREANRDDAAVIVRLVRELADEEGSDLTETYAAEHLSFPGCGVLLAEVDGKVAGLLAYSVRSDLYHASPTCLIEELIVQEAYRGQGVGGALVEELFRRARIQGCAEVSVTTMPDNHRAIKFYRSHGLVDEAVYLEKHF
jgi:ribosomal protein S18 acetylase RimI-like enzyme